MALLAPLPPLSGTAPVAPVQEGAIVPPPAVTVDGNTYVRDTRGNFQQIPIDRADEFLRNGYTPVTDAEFQANSPQIPQRSSALGAFGEGAASALSFGTSTALERLWGITPDEIEQREAEHPIAHAAGSGFGVLAPLLLSGGASAPESFGEGLANSAKGLAPGIINHLGKTIGEKTLEGVVEPGIARRLVAKATQGIVEGGLYGASQDVSDASLSPTPEVAASRFLAALPRDVGVSALLGGGLNTGFGVIGEALEAAKGTATAGKVADWLQEQADASLAKSLKLKPGQKIPTPGFSAVLDENDQPIELPAYDKALDKSTREYAGNLGDLLRSTKQSINDAYQSETGTMAREVKELLKNEKVGNLSQDGELPEELRTALEKNRTEINENDEQAIENKARATFLRDQDGPLAGAARAENEALQQGDAFTKFWQSKGKSVASIGEDPQYQAIRERYRIAQAAREEFESKVPADPEATAVRHEAAAKALYDRNADLIEDFLKASAPYGSRAAKGTARATDKLLQNIDKAMAKMAAEPGTYQSTGALEKFLEEQKVKLRAAATKTGATSHDVWQSLKKFKKGLDTYTKWNALATYGTDEVRGVARDLNSNVRDVLQDHDIFGAAADRELSWNDVYSEWKTALRRDQGFNLVNRSKNKGGGIEYSPNQKAIKGYLKGLGSPEQDASEVAINRVREASKAIRRERDASGATLGDPVIKDPLDIEREGMVNHEAMWKGSNKPKNIPLRVRDIITDNPNVLEDMRRAGIATTDSSPEEVLKRAASVKSEVFEFLDGADLKPVPVDTAKNILEKSIEGIDPRHAQFIGKLADTLIETRDVATDTISKDAILSALKTADLHPQADMAPYTDWLQGLLNATQRTSTGGQLRSGVVGPFLDRLKLSEQASSLAQAAIDGRSSLPMGKGAPGMRNRLLEYLGFVEGGPVGVAKVEAFRWAGRQADKYLPKIGARLGDIIKPPVNKFADAAGSASRKPLYSIDQLESGNVAQPGTPQYAADQSQRDSNAYVAQGQVSRASVLADVVDAMNKKNRGKETVEEAAERVAQETGSSKEKIIALATIQATADKTTQAVKDFAHNLVNGSIPFSAAALSLPIDDYLDRINKIKSFAADPSGLAEQLRRHTADVMDHAPDVATHMNDLIATHIMALNQARGTEHTGLGFRPPPNPEDIRQFSRDFELSQDPMGALNRGRIDSNTIARLDQLWPRLGDDVRRETLSALAEHEGNISSATQQAIANILGTSLVSIQSTQASIAAQQIYAGQVRPPINIPGGGHFGLGGSGRGHKGGGLGGVATRAELPLQELSQE